MGANTLTYCPTHDIYNCWLAHDAAQQERMVTELVSEDRREFVYLVDGIPTVGTFAQYVKARERSHHSDISVSRRVWFERANNLVAVDTVVGDAFAYSERGYLTYAHVEVTAVIDTGGRELQPYSGFMTVNLDAQ